MYTTQLFDVVTTAGVLYIVALGLLLVYGVLRIINLAHGAFLALGAYAAVVTTWWGWSPWAAAPLAFADGRRARRADGVAGPARALQPAPRLRPTPRFGHRQ